MEHDEIYLIDISRMFVREWRWFACVLVVVLAATAVVTYVARDQWQATAWIQIGQVGQVPAGEKNEIEPLLRVIERLRMVPFQNEVMASVGLAPDSPAARLYRKSIDLVPLPYAGPLVRMNLRGFSRQQARQFAAATVRQLQAIHQRLEAIPLQLAHARLERIEADLHHATTERDQLARITLPAGKSGTGSIDNPLLASVLVSSKNDEIRSLQRARSDLLDRLSSTYTFQTSMLGSIYVPEKKASPHLVLMWGVGILLGLLLGALAVLARNVSRRMRVGQPA
ncbi:MAG TPA: Wzz/FepE/Etk N-terminal domain-containing protein [Rhodanobacteraceae bacterium]|nr:Wzz/FepE/Etk N-terminal domain-containing protein [Rhodanobacteraceae bacterium]